ncbi:hypothetical protein C0993_008403 [Termitomyces sp. T159_Od127]|nr:hypothetical protein C0993_008403 [Termitomyces sp. T159_Od127]
MAIGPSLGSVLVRFTGNPLSVFYAAFGVHLIYAFIVSFIVPESLLRSQMEQSRLKHNIQLREAAENMAAGAYMRIKRLFAFLSPLKVFLPGFQETIPVVNTSKEGRDWNLTILAGVYALEISIIGSYTTQFQFAAATYGWTSETVGFIKFLKPRPRNIKNPEAERLLPGPSQKVLNKVPHSTAFDLGLARVSLFVEAVSYTLMALAPTELAFTGFSVMASLGAGLNPALQSVSLALYRRRGGTESGRLFGALSVLQALSSQLVSPAMYGLVYTKTVATFPRAIFILLMTTIVCSFVLLTSVRLPKPDVARASSNHVEGQSRPTASAPRS